MTHRLGWTHALSLGLGVATGVFTGPAFAFLGFEGGRGLPGYALSGGRRDFTSAGGMRADHGNVTGPTLEVAGQAMNMLSTLPAAPSGQPARLPTSAAGRLRYAGLT